MNRRSAILYGLLVAAVGASVWVSRQESGDADSLVARPGQSPQHVAGGTDRATTAPPSADAGGVGMRRKPFPALESDLFAARSFQPPPPPPPVMRAEAPQAPPLPFAYEGRMEKNGRTVVFLAEGETPVIAREGMDLANGYRVEKITENAITFVYKPLGQRQQLGLR